MKKYDFIIVGSGLYGLTFNYLARQEGYSCLIIERRKHIGGNIYTPIIDGIPIHQYGAHIFHTDEKEIWDFVCSKCEMVPFINSPIAIYNDELYNLPFNMNTFSKIFNVKTPKEAEDRIKQEILDENIIMPQNLEEQAISMVGRTIYEKLIKEYTEKQWGRPCTELPIDIIKRLPYRLTYDNNYFNDRYQGVPKGGYNDLIKNLLGDTIVIYDDYLKNKEYYNSIGKNIIYTGPIDEYFNYSEGCLEWRTVKFKTKKYTIKNKQGNAVCNYTSKDVPYTRTIEHKFFDFKGDAYDNNLTYVSEEYPIEWKQGVEPYYTINNEKNNALLELYKQKTIKEYNVLFAGRLGKYQYYDMDDTIMCAMNDFNQIKQDNELNIWVASHKDIDAMFEYEEQHKFIHVGAAINEETKYFFKDNVGDNISIKNRTHSELTGIYWVWKNKNNSKYVGFEHYRRHFNIKKDEVLDFLKEKDIILPEKEKLLDTPRRQYETSHSSYDMKTIELIINDMYPSYVNSFHTYMEHGNLMYCRNMFITRSEVFDEMCEFVFSILNEMEKRYNIKTTSDWERHIKLVATDADPNNPFKNTSLSYQLRVCGFLSERLFYLWIMHNIPQNRIKEYPISSKE